MASVGDQPKKISEMAWKDLFETVSETHRLLASDPAGAYSRMDFDSRDRYRSVLAELARHSAMTELQVAEAAIDLCRQAAAVSDGTRASLRRTHVGFYLIDRGRPQLETIVEYRPPLSQRIPRFILQYPTAFYLTGVELLTLFIVFAILYQLDAIAPALAGLLLLILPATQASADFINHLTTFLLPPRVLPKLDFSEGIPDDCATMVAVPTLLLNEAQIHDLALDLEIRFLVESRPESLLRAPDGYARFRPSRRSAGSVGGAVRPADRRPEFPLSFGRCSPFFMFHRHRSYNLAEGRWMGWERKRGKLLDLNQLLRGSYDAFPAKVGDLRVLPAVRYVITLDSDTQLPRDSAARLVGAMAHPLNQAVVDPDNRVVVEGYGIIQPRIGISVQSAVSQPDGDSILGTNRIRYLYPRHLGRLSGSFREGIFTGKGIYEVDTLREVLERRFPENALLSHDLIEGAYARAGLVSRHRADRRLSVALQRFQQTQAPLGARGLANHALDTGASSRFFREEDSQSDYADLAVENPRQSKAKSA